MWIHLMQKREAMNSPEEFAAAPGAALGNFNLQWFGKRRKTMTTGGWAQRISGTRSLSRYACRYFQLQSVLSLPSFREVDGLCFSLGSSWLVCSVQHQCSGSRCFPGIPAWVFLATGIMGRRLLRREREQRLVLFLWQQQAEGRTGGTLVHRGTRCPTS